MMSKVRWSLYYIKKEVLCCTSRLHLTFFKIKYSRSLVMRLAVNTYSYNIIIKWEQMLTVSLENNKGQLIIDLD